MLNYIEFVIEYRQVYPEISRLKFSWIRYGCSSLRITLTLQPFVLKTHQKKIVNLSMTGKTKIYLDPAIRGRHCEEMVRNAGRMGWKSLSDIIQRSPGFFWSLAIAYKTIVYRFATGFAMCVVCLLCTSFFSGGGLAYSEGYKLTSGVIHLDSTISGGTLSPEEVAKVAHNAGVEIAIFTDHDTMRWEYGLLPLRRFARKVVEKFHPHLRRRPLHEDHIQKTMSKMELLYKNLVTVHAV